MKGYILRIIFVVISLFFALESFSQEVQVIKSDELIAMISSCDKNKDLEIYNFWATWCAPCIKELPQFEEINEQFGNVRVTLISIDDVDLLEKKVKPFLKKKNINSTAVLLDETDFNDFINRVEPSWSGAIPATLIVDCRNDKTFFFEKMFDEGELEKTVKDIIN